MISNQYEACWVYLETLYKNKNKKNKKTNQTK